AARGAEGPRLPARPPRRGRRRDRERGWPSGCPSHRHQDLTRGQRNRGRPPHGRPLVKPASSTFYLTHLPGRSPSKTKKPLEHRSKGLGPSRPASASPPSPPAPPPPSP